MSMSKWIHRALPCLALPLALGLPHHPVSAQTADCVSRDQVLEMAKRGMSEEEIRKQLANQCPQLDAGKAALSPAAQPGPIVPGPSKIAIKNTGSVAYEAIDSCGYHPQRRELACDVEVRQRFGYNGTPPGTAGAGPGSFEWILFCADLGAGLEPISTSAVHLHDEAYGNPPNWYYDVVNQANPRLHQRALNGDTVRARAILSWFFPPAGCNAAPVWGNQADFRIKLDP